MDQSKRLEFLETLDAHRAEHAIRGRTLHSQPRDFLGFVHNTDIEADCRVLEPRKVAFLATKTVLAFAQVEDRAVVDDLALVVTPHGVRNAPRLDLRHVARYEAIEVVERIGPG